MTDGSRGAGGQPWHRMRPGVAVLLLLTAVAGSLDAVAFVDLVGVFVCNQTGNALLLGISIAEGRASDSVPGAISLAAFVLGAGLAGRLLPPVRPGARWPSRTATAIAVEVVAIAASAALWLAGASNAVVIGPIAAAMGVQTTLAGRVALEHLTSGFLTGTLSSAAMRSPLGDHSNPWWWYALAPLLVLIVAAGAVSVVAVESVSWALGIAALLGLAAWMVSWSATDAGRRSART